MFSYLIYHLFGDGGGGGVNLKLGSDFSEKPLSSLLFVLVVIIEKFGIVKYV